MPMSHNGLTKLVEECGELTQIAAKKIAYPDTDHHPDGACLRTRLQEEIADVIAACGFVIATFDLDTEAIEARVSEKLDRYEQWHADPNS